ncbi:MAG TPA: hypothetical protein VFG86_22350 [Chloroflexota bacterium]|nr:hypothetical protein [Chloroflexota bacterium]
MEPREIRNVALLDLTGAEAGAALEGVTRIVNVATILVPQSLVPKLSSIPLERVAATVPIPDGRRVRVFSGQITMAGEARAAPADGVEETLVITGQLILTSPCTEVGRDVVVMGQVVAPSGSEAGLGRALRNMTGQATYYPYTPGARVFAISGGQMAGEALASLGGQPEDLPLITGSLILTSKPESVGYNSVIVLGNVLVPRGGEATLYGRVLPQGGRIIAYDAPTRVFDGSYSIGATFFEMLPEPITLVIDGHCTIDADVTPEMVRDKVRGLVFDGHLTAPRTVLGALQAVALSLDGKLSADDSVD